MVSRLRTQVYDVTVKPVKMDIEEEKTRFSADVEIGHIDPYGLKPTVREDIEIKSKVEPAVIKQHISEEIEKHDISNQGATSRRQRTNHK